MDGHGISLSRTVSNKALLHPCVPYNPLRAMQHHFVVPKCPNSSKISPSSQVLPCLFWGRCQIPRLGVSCSSGAAFRVCFFFAFFGGRCQIPRLGVSCSSGAAFRAWVLLLPFLGGDAKSLAWVFLARRVLPFVLGFFFGLFWGRCQIPRLGVSCSSGAAFRVCFFLRFLGGDAKSLAWVFRARRVLPFRVGVLFWPFLGAMPNPSLGCFLLVGCLLNGWSWDQSI